MTTQDAVILEIKRKFEMEAEDPRSYKLELYFLEAWELGENIHVYEFETHRGTPLFHMGGVRMVYDTVTYTTLVLHLEDKLILLRTYDYGTHDMQTTIDRIYLSRSGKSIMVLCCRPDRYEWYHEDVYEYSIEQYELKDYIK